MYSALSLDYTNLLASCQGYHESLDEVMYLLSIEAENLVAYLTSEEIYAQEKNKLEVRKTKCDRWHPMESVLEGVL